MSRFTKLEKDMIDTKRKEKEFNNSIKIQKALVRVICDEVVNNGIQIKSVEKKTITARVIKEQVAELTKLDELTPIEIMVKVLDSYEIKIDTNIK